MKAVLFDVDGTLVDTVDLHAESWVRTFRHIGHEVPFEAVRAQIGKGGDQLMPVFLAEDVVDRRGKEMEAFRKDLYMSELIHRARPFPGVAALFRHLRADGRRIILASSGKPEELDHYKKLLGIEGLVDAATTSDDAERSKPFPDIFLAALDGLPADQAIVVGDSPYDAEAAGKAGLRTIGLLCGGSRSRGPARRRLRRALPRPGGAAGAPRRLAPGAGLSAMAAWWQGAVIYQVYPRSFQDSDGDGVGDLPGIAARLDHLLHLGVDALWISPFYPSPMADFGYDVADHCDVDPVFGRLADFERLVAAAHDRGLRVILDYVPNHTADTHPWFVASRASRTGPKRDWYIWRDPAPDGGPPNNWLSEFGGSAWTLDAATGQYFYHAYLPQQPDLNWRNPAVQAAMLDVLRFWLERGVDGFRVDAIHHLIEDAAFRDNPPNPDWRPDQSPARRLIRARTMDQPELQPAIAAMRRITDAYPGERLLIGEAWLPIDRLIAYYGEGGTGFHLPFNFHLITTPWQAGAIAGLICRYEAALPEGAWPNWVLGNHDRSRIVSRIGPEQARIAAMLLLTLRGTPTIYQGEELGLTDVPIPPALVRDPWEKRVPGLGLGRDPVRTPMPWEDAPQAGFTTGTPWLPLGEDHAALSVAAQAHDPWSMLSLYRELLMLRRREAALSLGPIMAVAAAGDVLRYERQDPQDGRRLLVALNLGGTAQPLEARGTPLLSTQGDYGSPRRLRPHEGLVVELD